ncbi:ABC transporter ATP-binding protein [Georgenia sp. SYP-B2076]|uniref:ABC transporter ATP-binding protein n=1 Tax=Georgenia sp. SYP-B2076 TaxID=2495881 RepID=UPI000F8C8A4A|nr:ATP-binding cassette domain-containing protein [Georgenia sp. SYP-B2076]
MYTLTGVSKIFRNSGETVHALRAVDLEIGDGQMVTIQGRAGAGKSALVRILGAADRPTSGSVLLGQEDLAEATDKRLDLLRAGDIGVVSGSPRLFPTLTAEENVELTLVRLGIAAPARRGAAHAALVAVGMADHARELAARLTGVERQRVAIARAMVRSPQVLLADEPTGGLDEAGREAILAVIDGVRREPEHGVTVVVATRDPAVAARAERLLLLDRGTVLEAAPMSRAA